MTPPCFVTHMTCRTRNSSPSVAVCVVGVLLTLLVGECKGRCIHDALVANQDPLTRASQSYPSQLANEQTRCVCV